ncbi:peroxiredoxin-like family protein [Undibacterium cyanobacteriorum]|uniref:Peroxiredoxin-like family protein n=1 Tax=Undibacterium cyanobacteriorum TaxID=3073561 RepID=A0ABY9RHS3_9BURK|nr:peroxiredoxin-like family protein [Undibacterium sp. 20NA77.5]WMW79646.1 peroxiredoxin-like family protein [Undibacterium sp. 20NA77.5]
MMAKIAQLQANGCVPETNWQDIQGVTLEVPHRTLWTHLQFRRYAQCPICNLHVRDFFRNHEKIHRAGIQEIIIFQSTREQLVSHLHDGNVHVIADPKRQLYQLFGVQNSMRSVLHPGAWWSAMKGAAKFGMHLPRNAESMFGMPADFLISPEGVIVEAHYGRHADDHWSVEDLIQKRSVGR